MLKVFYPKLHCTLYFAGAQASGANLHPSGGAVNNSPDPLQVRTPGPLGTDVRVTDLDSTSNTFTAYSTNLGHVQTSFAPESALKARINHRGEKSLLYSIKYIKKWQEIS
jgi:hypothetical protein